jgi:hypothetical protein
MALSAHSAPWTLIQFRNHFSQSVGLLGRVISPSQGRYLNTGQHKHRINAYTHQTSMPWVGFESTIPVSQRMKTVYALDRAATVKGSLASSRPMLRSSCNLVTRNRTSVIDTLFRNPHYWSLIPNSCGTSLFLAFGRNNCCIFPLNKIRIKFSCTNFKRTQIKFNLPQQLKCGKTHGVQLKH